MFLKAIKEPTMKVVILLSISILISIAAPCFAEDKGQEKQETWNYCDEIRRFADPITENILLMINEDNYVQFSKDFSQQMKTAIPESKYKEMRAGFNSKLGNYVSKEFVSIEIRENYISVSYKAKFSQASAPFLIRTVFTRDNHKTYLAGFWLNPLKYLGNINKQ